MGGGLHSNCHKVIGKVYPGQVGSFAPFVGFFKFTYLFIETLSIHIFKLFDMYVMSDRGDIISGTLLWLASTEASPPCYTNHLFSRCSKSEESWCKRSMALKKEVQKYFVLYSQ